MGEENKRFGSDSLPHVPVISSLFGHYFQLKIVLASNPIVFRAGFTFVLHRLLRVGVLGRTGLGSVRILGICTAFCSTLCWMAPDAPAAISFP